MTPEQATELLELTTSNNEILGNIEFMVYAVACVSALAFGLMVWNLIIRAKNEKHIW